MPGFISIGIGESDDGSAEAMTLPPTAYTDGALTISAGSLPAMIDITDGTGVTFASLAIGSFYGVDLGSVQSVQNTRWLGTQANVAGSLVFEASPDNSTWTTLGAIALVANAQLDTGQIAAGMLCRYLRVRSTAVSADLHTCNTMWVYI